MTDGMQNKILQEYNSEEHILACLSSSPSNTKIIKTAAQMSKAFGGKFTALYVKTPESENMTRENRERLETNIRLAESLGAEIATVYADDIAQQIIEFVRLSKITKVVIGRSSLYVGRLFYRHTITDKLIKSSPGLDIYIIPNTEIKKNRGFYGTFSALKYPTLIQWAWMILILFLSTALGFLFRLFYFTEANTITVYMLGVLIVAIITKNYICSGVFSLASVLLFNFFFTEPQFTFKTYESGYPVTFVIMLTVSLLMGTLAYKVAASVKLSANTAYRTNIMLQANLLLQKTDSEDAVIAIMAQQLVKLLSRNIVIYRLHGNNLGMPQVFPTERGGDPDMLLSNSEINVATHLFENKEYTDINGIRIKNSACVYFSVKTNNTVFCIVGVEIGNKPIEHFECSILISILGESALAIENLRNVREKEKITLLAKNEKLRANLLRTISHDLRTPLTSISGNAETLLANYNNLDDNTRCKILKDISDDSGWLISLVENLLSVSRISEGQMNINLSAQLVDEVITEALKHVDRKAIDHEIITDFGNELLLAKMDARLISQVIINLVDNAIKYTPKGSIITVSAKPDGNHIIISVADNGNGIPDEQKKEVFRMFYTGNNSIADCRRSLGLGLSLCESIINAHQGKLTLTDNKPHGCIFSFTLEKSEVYLSEQ